MRERSVRDMLALLRSEKLKMRHSFGGLLPLSAAMLQIFISLMLSRGTDFFTINAWNWWYTMILPGMLAVLCYLNMQKEKKQHYANMLLTSIAPDYCWMSKIFYCAVKLLCANLIFFIGVFAGGLLFGASVSPAAGLMAAILLSVCYLWSIPLYLMLSARFGMFAAVFVCMGLTVGSLILLGATKLWWLCPASIPFRLMCPVLGIMPNGLLVEPGSRYMNPAVIFPGILLSLLWFAAFTFMTVRWFRRAGTK